MNFILDIQFPECYDSCMEENKIECPTLHLNGSGYPNLQEGYFQTLDDLRTAYDSLRQTAPHGRDYYVVPGSYEKALDQWSNRMKRLDSVMGEIANIIYNIDNQRRTAR